MNLLAIDTSTSQLSLALALEDQNWVEESSLLPQQAQGILPAIQRLLSASSVKLGQLDAIAFGCGPGSFTGLRIACSVAKALAYAHDLPLYPVSTLAAIAYAASEQEGDNRIAVLSVLDARMQQVYWGYFASPEWRVEERVSAPSDLIVPDYAVFKLAGVGFEPYLPQFSAALQARITQTVVTFPGASAIIQLVRSGQFKAVSADEALPVYIRNQVTQG